MNLNEFAIAKLCHEANRAICEASGDHSQKPWNEADDWQKKSAVNGVLYKLNHPEATPKDQHDAWCRDKIADGWIYGSVKSVTLKTHPCLVDYDQLPFEQRVKDHVFAAIVSAAIS